MDNFTTMAQILGERNVNVFKQKLTDIILNQFQNDLDSRKFWLFDPDDLEEFICSIYDECKKEIKAKIKAKMMDEIEKKMRIAGIEV